MQRNGIIEPLSTATRNMETKCAFFPIRYPVVTCAIQSVRFPCCQFSSSPIEFLATFFALFYLILTHSTMLNAFFGFTSITQQEKLNTEKKTSWQQSMRRMLLLGEFGVSLRLHSDAMKHETWNICIEYLLTARNPFSSNFDSWQLACLLRSRFPFYTTTFVSDFASYQLCWRFNSNEVFQKVFASECCREATLTVAQCSRCCKLNCEFEEFMIYAW